LRLICILISHELDALCLDISPMGGGPATFSLVGLEMLSKSPDEFIEVRSWFRPTRAALDSRERLFPGMATEDMSNY